MKKISVICMAAVLLLSGCANRELSSQGTAAGSENSSNAIAQTEIAWEQDGLAYEGTSPAEPELLTTPPVLRIEAMDEMTASVSMMTVGGYMWEYDKDGNGTMTAVIADSMGPVAAAEKGMVKVMLDSSKLIKDPKILLTNGGKITAVDLYAGDEKTSLEYGEDGSIKLPADSEGVCCVSVGFPQGNCEYYFLVGEDINKDTASGSTESVPPSEGETTPAYDPSAVSTSVCHYPTAEMMTESYSPEEAEPVMIWRHTNYAWEPVDFGVVYDSRGYIYKFDFSGEDISEDELVQRAEELMDTEPAGFDSELVRCNELIPLVDESAEVTEEHAGYDIGQETLYVIRGGKLIEISSEGDWNVTLRDEAAQKIYEIVKSVMVPHDQAGNADHEVVFPDGGSGTVMYTYPSYIYRTDGYVDGMEYPQTITITTAEQLEEYISTMREYYQVGNMNVSDYDDGFFAEKALVMAVIEESSGSVSHKINGITEDNKIIVERTVPMVGTCDMAEYNIVVEIPAEKADEDFEVVFSTVFLGE